MKAYFTRSFEGTSKVKIVPKNGIPIILDPMEDNPTIITNGSELSFCLTYSGEPSICDGATNKILIEWVPVLYIISVNGEIRYNQAISSPGEGSYWDEDLSIDLLPDYDIDPDGNAWFVTVSVNPNGTDEPVAVELIVMPLDISNPANGIRPVEQPNKSISYFNESVEPGVFLNFEACLSREIPDCSYSHFFTQTSYVDGRTYKITCDGVVVFNGILTLDSFEGGEKYQIPLYGTATLDVVLGYHGQDGDTTGMAFSNGDSSGKPLMIEVEIIGNLDDEFCFIKDPDEYNGSTMYLNETPTPGYYKKIRSCLGGLN